MIRLPAAAVAIALSCLVTPLWAQAQPTPATRTVAKKPAAPRSTAASTPVMDDGPCTVGVVPATADLFTVQKVGLIVFGNEYAEVPVNWGLDDLVFARVQAAAGGIPVRRIAYPRGAFDAYYHTKASLFRNARRELTTLVQRIAGNAGCERYLVIARFEGELQGTNQMLNGIGVLNRDAGLFRRTYVFANIGVLVIDGQTFEIRRDPSASLEGVMARLGSSLTAETMRQVDDSAFPASPPDAANNTILRDAARAFLTSRLDKALPAYFKP